MGNTIGEKIHQLRKLNGYTLQDLGDSIGVGRSSIQKYESGVITKIPYDKIIGLAKKLGTTPGYLMGWEDGETYVESHPVDECMKDAALRKRLEEYARFLLSKENGK